MIKRIGSPGERSADASMGAAPKAVKPLGRKAYGSIPHLPGSRLGPGDWTIHEGQRAICMDRARDRHDRIIVTEKLDGSNVAVARVGNEILAVTRAGYLASDSPYPQHHIFGDWVAQQKDRFRRIMDPGERLNGEWLALAHGTIYNLPHEPFVAFDMMVEAKRLPWDEIKHRCAMAQLPYATVLSDGPPIHVDAILPMLARSGHGAVDPVEGAVWRVERKGVFDFNAKWVRPDKIDGKYIEGITGHPEVWLWQPHEGLPHPRQQEPRERI